MIHKQNYAGDEHEMLLLRLEMGANIEDIACCSKNTNQVTHFLRIFRYIYRGPFKIFRMTLHILQDKNYRWRHTKICYVRYNARYGRIHVSAGILDLFGIPYGEPVFVQFAQDCNTLEWYLTLTRQKAIDAI